MTRDEINALRAEDGLPPIDPNQPLWDLFEDFGRIFGQGQVLPIFEQGEKE